MTGRGSVAVATGILASRVLGLVRQKVFAFTLGAGDAADAFNLAFRIPNLLQNLFGEGALSASFIPVYSRLLAAGDDAGRQRVAGAVFGLLSLVVALLVVIGVAAAPWLVDVVASGVEGDRRVLTIHLVRILFPGAGLLVLSAWCLGVLNSHRRFLLSYAAPVAWNVSMIVALVLFGGRDDLHEVARLVAWGSVLGSALQVAIQWPTVRRVLGPWRVSTGRGVAHVRTVVRNFWPALIGRGVTQVSAYVDTGIASHLILGSPTILANAQTLYMLPISLFGISVSAAQLPEMSGDAADIESGMARLRERLRVGLEQVAFWVIPCAVAFATVGDVVAALLFRGGRFGAEETTRVWGTLAALSVGLLAATLARVYATTLYALQDTRTPQRIAVWRVLVGALLAIVGAFRGPAWIGVGAEWGVAFLALGSALAAWLEWYLLKRAVHARLGPSGAGAQLWKPWLASAIAGAVAWGAGHLTTDQHLAVRGLAVTISFAVVYALITLRLEVPGARALVARWRPGRPR